MDDDLGSRCRRVAGTDPRALEWERLVDPAPSGGWVCGCCGIKNQGDGIYIYIYIYIYLYIYIYICIYLSIYIYLHTRTYLSAYARQPARGPWWGEGGRAGSKSWRVCYPSGKRCRSSLGLDVWDMKKADLLPWRLPLSWSSDCCCITIRSRWLDAAIFMGPPSDVCWFINPIPQYVISSPTFCQRFLGVFSIVRARGLIWPFLWLLCQIS